MLEAAATWRRARTSGLHVLEVERPEPADPEEVAALLVVEIVVERALLTVLEEQADEAGATRDDGGPLLDDGTLAPLLVPDVRDAIAEAKVDPLVLGRVLHGT